MPRGRRELFGSLDVEVLDGCDAAYICTWTSAHRWLVELAARRGKAIFCEKPLATNLADATAMAEAVAHHAVTNQIGLILRRSPAYLLARELVRDPKAGRVMNVVFCERRHIVIEGDWFGPVRWTDSDGTSGDVEGDALIAATTELSRGGHNPDLAFVRAALADEPAWPDFTVGIEAHRVVDSMYRSASGGGRAVRL